ncbi:MAG TPA: holo-ACP synthase [Ktedonobacterales bacterium]|nr:holo-ACP synthase [Ktedonobacterales bacterium]
MDTPPDGCSTDSPSPLGGSMPVALAVGVDVIERARVLRAYERFGARFLRRVFTELEIEQAAGRIEKLVGRFAAKEAVSKALGTGIGQIAWREIEIQRMPGGNPVVRLTGRASERARALGLAVFDVSISDTQTHAFAVVVGAGVG